MGGGQEICPLIQEDNLLASHKNISTIHSGKTPLVMTENIGVEIWVQKVKFLLSTDPKALSLGWKNKTCVNKYFDALNLDKGSF